MHRAIVIAALTMAPVWQKVVANFRHKVQCLNTVHDLNTVSLQWLTLSTFSREDSLRMTPRCYACASMLFGMAVLSREGVKNGQDGIAHA